MAVDPAVRPSPVAAPPRAARAPRRDGEAARARLLQAALPLFSKHGYTRTSTRDIAEAAGANIAGIAYHFGDKAGLYRAVFAETLQPPPEMPGPGETWPLARILRSFFAGFLEPLKDGEVARHCVRLHMREMLEPTGVWESLVAEIGFMHASLVAALVDHLGVRRADDDVHRLAVCVAALGVHQHVACDVIDAVTPQLTTDAAAIDTLLDRLVVYAVGMVEAEAARRAAAVLRPKAASKRAPVPASLPIARKR